jgi:acyl carrier protein
MFDISSKRGRPMYRNTCTASLRDLHQIRQLSRAIALTSLMLGAASGLVLGLWAFGGPLPKPAWFGDYGETSRRLFRLGHIAFFGLGILNLILIRQLQALALSERSVRRALASMNFGNLVLPPALLATGAHAPFVYLLPVPALCIFLALAIATFGGWRQWALDWTSHRLETIMTFKATEAEIRLIVAQAARREPAELGPHEDFSEDLGLDSLDRLELLAAVEDHCDVRLSTWEISQATTLAGLLQVLDVPERGIAA